MYTDSEQAVLRQWAWESEFGTRKRLARREASCQIRTERKTKASFKKVDSKGQPMDQKVHSTQFLRRKRT